MRTVNPGLINRYKGCNLEGKLEFANSGPWCQLILVTSWVNDKLGGQSRRLDHWYLTGTSNKKLMNLQNN